MSGYALIENGIVINMVEWDGNLETWSPLDGQIAIPMPEGIGLSIGWLYDESGFHAPAPPVIPDSELAATARSNREYLLRNIYDPGILMAQRALRLASTPEETSYAEGKIVELDAYAEALLSITEQAEFPRTVNWPPIPVR